MFQTSLGPQVAIKCLCCSGVYGRGDIQDIHGHTSEPSSVPRGVSLAEVGSMLDSLGPLCAQKGPKKRKHTQRTWSKRVRRPRAQAWRKLGANFRQASRFLCPKWSRRGRKSWKNTHLPTTFCAQAPGPGESWGQTFARLGRLGGALGPRPRSSDLWTDAEAPVSNPGLTKKRKARENRVCMQAFLVHISAQEASLEAMTKPIRSQGQGEAI